MAGNSTYPTIFLLGQIAMTASVAVVTMMLPRAGAPVSLVPVTLQAGRSSSQLSDGKMRVFGTGPVKGSFVATAADDRAWRTLASLSVLPLARRQAAALLNSTCIYRPIPGGLGDRSCSTSW